jgi:prephenate dehydrogenase
MRDAGYQSADCVAQRIDLSLRAALQHGFQFVANLLVKMDLRPTRMTTKSFEALMSAVEMVRHDAPEVLKAILGANPYAGDVLKRLKSLTSDLEEPRNCGIHLEI